MTTTIEHREALETNPLVKLGGCQHSYWVDDEGVPVAAIDGYVLVVRGATSLEQMCETLKAARTPGHVTTAQALGLIKAVIARPSVVTEAVHSRLRPDVFTRTEWLDAMRKHIHCIEVRSAELRAAIATRRRTKADDRTLLEYKRDLRKAQSELRKQTAPSCYAIVVGQATFDRRVITRALRALRTSKGELTASGAFDPAFLRTEKGAGLIMPFRP